MSELNAGSVTYTIKGNTSELKKSLKDAVNVQEDYAAKVKKATDKLKLLKAAEESAKAALERGEIGKKEFNKLATQVKNAEGNLNLLNVQYEAAQKLAGELSQEMNELEKSVDEVAEEFDEAAESAGDAAEELEKVSEQTISMGDIIKADVIASGIRKIADIAVEGAKALAEFAKNGTELASDLQEVQNVVDVTFGDNNNQIYEFANTAAEKFGISKVAAQQYSGTIGAMLKSSGITEGIADMSTAMAGLAADMASFYNLDADTAFEKIRSGISGETEPLKQLGINMSVANLEAYALAQGIETSYDKMSQAEQVLLRYNYLMDQTADAQGDFARTSDNFANQQRILEMNMETVGAVMGEELLPAANDLISMINEHMPEIQEAAEYLGGELADALEKLAEKAGDFIENGGLEKGIDCFEWIIDNGDKLITVGTGITALISAEKIGKKVEGVTALVSQLKAFVDLDGGITSLGGSIAAAGTSATTAAAGFSAVAAAMMAAATAALAIKDATIDKWYEELNAQEEKINGITDEINAINEETAALHELANAQSEAYNPSEARQKALSELSTYADKREEIQQRITEIGNKLSTGGYETENGGYYFFDATDRERLKQEQNALRSELEAIEANRDEKLAILNRCGSAEIESYENQQQAYNQAVQNQGKTTADVVTSVWENISQKTAEKMDELDEEYAKHNLTRQEYLEQGIDYLEKHRNEDSVEWWEYYDSLTEELAQMGEEQVKQIEENAKAAENALKEGIEKSLQGLEIKQLEDGLSDEWLYDEWEKLIADLDHDSDLYLDNYQKILEGRNKLQEKANDEAVSEAEDFQKSYEALLSQSQSLADSISTNVSSLFNETTTTDIRTGEQNTSYNLQIEEFEKKIAAKKQLSSIIAELYKKNAPDELINELIKLDPETALKYANELLNSPDKLSSISAGLSADDEYSSQIASLVTSHSEEYSAFGEEMGECFGESFWEAFSEYAFSLNDLFSNGISTDLGLKMSAADAAVSSTSSSAVQISAVVSDSNTSAGRGVQTSAGGDKTVVLDSVNGTWLATLVNSVNKQNNIITGG